MRATHLGLSCTEPTPLPVCTETGTLIQKLFQTFGVGGNGGTCTRLRRHLTKLFGGQSFLIIWDMTDAPPLNTFPTFRFRPQLRGPVPGRRRRGTEEPLPDCPVAPYHTVRGCHPGEGTRKCTRKPILLK